MLEMFEKVFKETIEITLIVALMMILVDLINTWTNGKIKTFLEGEGKYRQYVLSSFIGSLPGCFGGITNVSLYMHGLISFGALAGSMIAVSGDEAYIMLAMIPKTAILIFAILFVLGIFGGIIVDKIVNKLKINVCVNCENLVIHEKEKSLKHFLLEHIWEHIIKKHIWKIAIWTFLALLVVELTLKYIDLSSFTSNYKIAFLFIAALVGLIPESGPHIIFVKLFADGMIPFSVLLTSSIVQDGHGMLPMLSYSIEDTVKIKIFNFTFGIIIGLIFFSFGL
ncbi:MAG: arsenic efflux protein [Ignavibacteria bacterium]|nr:arsenic efflux protein [Ignavibacteria bacterium]